MKIERQEDIQEKDYPNRRRPWVAVFLSLLMPGMGQIYCGSIVNGLVLMLIVIMFSSLWMFGMVIDKVRHGIPMAVFLTMWGFVLLATIVAAIDAYYRARRTRYDYKLKDYNNLEVYLVLFWMCGAGTFGFIAMIKMNLFEAFYVPVNSMAPTIMAGDRTFASKVSYKYNSPQYGDVVLFENPEDRKMSFIKRVVALGGDTVEIKDGQLLINGKVLERELIGPAACPIDEQEVKGEVFWEHNKDSKYRVFISDSTPGPKVQEINFGPVTVPAYHCFVLGDNRRHSLDSRNFGSLSIGALKGKLTQIYWPLHRSASLEARQGQP